MATIAPSSLVRTLCQHRLEPLLAELESAFESELSARSAAADQRARSELSETLNQYARRLRQARGFGEISAILVDLAGRFCHGLAVFRIRDNMVQGERVRAPLNPPAAERFAEIRVRLEDGPAFAGTLESGDPVVAMATEKEISSILVDFFQHREDDRIYLFPLVVKEQTAGVVYAWGDVQQAAVELLVQVAALAIDAVPQLPVPTPPGLIAIQVAEKALGRSSAQDWSHFAAQRFARVHVAEMRLYRTETVDRARAARNIYSALQEPIDDGRKEFRNTFVLHDPTMIDYFHLELLHTLANDDADLLGKDYPGPLL